MLGDKINFTISYGEKEYILEFTVKALKNIFTFTGENPFYYLQEFIKATDIEDIKLYITQLIICITDAELDVFDIAENVITDENLFSLKYGLINLIQMELKSEIKEDINKKDNEGNNEVIKVKEETEQDKVDNFIKWFNDIYYIAIYQLNMNYEEFMSSTVRELKTLEKFHRNFYKECLLSAYIDVMKSRNKSDKKELEENKKTIADGKNGLRIKDMLLFAK